MKNTDMLMKLITRERERDGETRKKEKAREGEKKNNKKERRRSRR